MRLVPERAYIIFTLINKKGDTQSIQQELMIHIGNQLKLPLKIKKKEPVRSTQHTANRSICSPNKILFHLIKK